LSIAPRFFLPDGGGGRVPAPALRSLEQRQDGEGQTLVKVEAAGGGGRRPAFTRVWPSPRLACRDRGPSRRLLPAVPFAAFRSANRRFSSMALEGRRGHTFSFAAAAAFVLLDALAAPKARSSARPARPDCAAGRLIRSGGLGLSAVPDPIRGVPLSAQAEGLHARIRRSCGNSRPQCPIREARGPGTEGTGPISRRRISAIARAATRPPSEDIQVRFRYFLLA